MQQIEIIFPFNLDFKRGLKTLTMNDLKITYIIKYHILLILHIIFR